MLCVRVALIPHLSLMVPPQKICAGCWECTPMIKCGLLTMVVAMVLAVPAAQSADLPGQRFSISPASLSKPYATPAVANDSKAIARPAGALPKAPAGFAVSIFAANLPHARWMTVASNGDVFLAESDAGQ